MGTEIEMIDAWEIDKTEIILTKRVAPRGRRKRLIDGTHLYTSSLVSST